MEIFILLVIVIFGGVFYWIRTNNSESNREQAPTSLPSYPQPSSVSKPKKIELNLTENKKIDNEITSDTITLISKSSFARDEFFASIDVIDGHHPEPLTIGKDDKIKSYTYLGFGDRYDSAQRSKEFKQLTKMFRECVDEIVAEMTADGWTTELASDTQSKRIFLLTRE